MESRKSKKIEFHNGDEDTPSEKSSSGCEMSRRENMDVSKIGTIAFSIFKSSARFLDRPANIPSTGAAVQKIPLKLPLEAHVGMETQQSNFYLCHSAKTFLKEYFEIILSTHLDATQQMTSTKKEPNDLICFCCWIRSGTGIVWIAGGRVSKVFSWNCCWEETRRCRSNTLTQVSVIS